MNAMLDPSTHAANTHVRRRFAQGVALAVERMISSSQGRACRPLMVDAPVQSKLVAAQMYPAVGHRAQLPRGRRSLVEAQPQLSAVGPSRPIRPAAGCYVLRADCGSM
jgi:hypothetical protein